MGQRSGDDWLWNGPYDVDGNKSGEIDDKMQ